MGWKREAFFVMPCPVGACGRSRAHGREPGRIQGGCPGVWSWRCCVRPPLTSRPATRFCALQFMNNDYVGEQKGRCSNYGFDKNEVHHAWLRFCDRSVCGVAAVRGGVGGKKQSLTTVLSLPVHSSSSRHM